MNLKGGFTARIRVTRKTTDELCYSIPCINIDYLCLNGSTITARHEVGSCRTITVFATHGILVHGLVYTTSKDELTGGFLVLPNNYLGCEYLVDCYSPMNDRAQFSISAIHNDTRVSIDCTNYCQIDNELVTNAVYLNAGESAFVETLDLSSSIAGTRIHSNNPISVVVGSANVYIKPPNSDQSTLDRGFIVEQLLPVSAWGRTHIVPPFLNATNGWIVRVMAYSSNTTLLLTNCGEVESEDLVIDSRDFKDIPVTSTDQMCVVVGDKPIQVVQYMSSSLNYQHGDPSMLLIPPLQDFHGNTSVVTEPADYLSAHADVVTYEQGKAGLRLNNEAIDEGSWYCFNTSDPFAEEYDSKEFCYCHTRLQETVRTFASISDESSPFLVRLYSQREHVGAAMLADITIPSGKISTAVADPEGGATGARPPKIGSTMFFIHFLTIRMLENKAQIARESIKITLELDPCRK